MSNIVKYLFALTLCLLGMAAHAEIYTPEFHPVAKGDKLELLANAHLTTVPFIMKNNPQIKDPDHIEVGWVIELPKIPAGVTPPVVAKSAVTPVMKMASAVRTTTKVTEEVPNFDQPCTGCTLDAFLAKSDLPTYVKASLWAKVMNGEFEDISVATGEQFELVQFTENRVERDVVTAWPDGHEMRARLYTANSHGIQHQLVYHSAGGNWSTRTSPLDIAGLLDVKHALEDIAGPPYDVMPLAALIWRNRNAGIPPPEQPRRSAALELELTFGPELVWLASVVSSRPENNFLSFNQFQPQGVTP